MFIINVYKVNANQNGNDISPPTSENGLFKPSVCGNQLKKETSFTVDKSLIWFSLYGNSKEISKRITKRGARDNKVDRTFALHRANTGLILGLYVVS